MRILALETVTAAGSLALWEDGVCRGMAGDPSIRHGERLPSEITRWLEREGLRLGDLDLLAVACGPGSFTGLRVGIATMQGFAAAGRKRVIGVPSLDAMVAAWHTASSGPGLVAPCLDGHRGEVFYALVETGSEPHALDAWRTLVPPGAARPETAAHALAAAAEGRDVALVGNGAERHAAVWQSVPTLHVRPSPMTIAEGAAWVASRRIDHAGPPHALQPIYLRRTDAERGRDQYSSSSETAAPWTVRRAHSAADLAAVEALQAASFASPWGAEAFRWELEHTDVARLYVLTASTGRIVAYCACWVVVDELHINSLAVDARDRRQGAASVLLRHVMAEAAAAGAKAATLEVRASNRPALQLYQAHGFTVEATRRDYYQDPREDALVLWKRCL
jgi:ribosomal-protein-alanine N-acetyltransferase